MFADDVNSARFKFVEPNRGSNAIGAAVFVLLLILLIVRLTRGVDLGDESYYAIFIDDWLKGGIATSTLLSIHQTAALIVYPATRLYASLTGSSDGLFFFLRVLYLFGAAASAICWIIFLRRLGHRWMAWGGGVLVLAFVPFGLPAPSYNTLGQQALTIALASFGCAALGGNRGREQWCWLIVSACAWAVSTVAYPSVIVPCGCLCLIGLFYRDGPFPRPISYILLVGSAICIAWFVVVLSLTWSRFHQTLLYLSAAYDVGELVRKIMFSLDTLKANMTFSILLIVAIITGLTSRFYPRSTRILFVAVIACLFAIVPALFARSHDAVTLAALMGLGLLSGLRAGTGQVERVTAFVYATSLIAALITCASSFNGIFNFCIGAIPAAALATVGLPSPKPLRLAALLPVSVTILAVLSTSLFFYYGELPGKPISSREFMADGFFAGLAVGPDDAVLLRLMHDSINPLLKANPSVAILGRLPGLVLATPARLNMPNAYALMPSMSMNAHAFVKAFYEQPGHQPSLVLIYRDIFFTALNPISQFDDRYVPYEEFKTPLGELAVFRKQ